MNRVVHIILFIIIYISLTSAQDSAVDFGAKCEVYKGDPTCQGALYNGGESVYIQSGYTQETIIENLKSVQYKIGLICSNKTDFVLKLGQTFSCNQAFRPCKNATLDGSSNGESSVVIFQSQCNDICLMLRQYCGIPAVLLDCNELYTNSTLSYYPKVSNTFPLSSYGGNDTTETCLDSNKIINNGTGATFECPSPLIGRNSTGRQREIDTENGYVFVGELNCVFPCPAPMFTDRQWKMFYDTIKVSSIISFICTTSIIFTYFVMNRKYDRHAICIIFIAFGMWCINLTDMIMIGKGPYNITCPEKDRNGVQSDVDCSVTGAIFQFGCVLAILWWSTMAFDLWLVLRRVKTQRSYEKYYIVVLSLISIFLTVLPAGKKKYSATFGGLGCWIGDNNFLNGVFWFPLTFCLLVGVVFIILILREVYNVVKRVDTGKKKSIRILKYNLKPFLIILFLFIEFIYLFGYHFYLQTSQDKIEDQMATWVQCLIDKQSKPDLDCTLNPIPFGGQFFFYFFVRLLGIELLIFYGINRRAKRIWMKSFVFHNRFYSLTFTQSKTSVNSSTHTSHNDKTIKMSSHHTSRATFDEASIEVSDVTPNDDVNNETRHQSPQLQPPRQEVSDPENAVNNNDYDDDDEDEPSDLEN